MTPNFALVTLTFDHVNEIFTSHDFHALIIDQALSFLLSHPSLSLDTVGAGKSFLRSHYAAT